MPRSGYFRQCSVGLTSTSLPLGGNHRDFVCIGNPTQDALYISFGVPATVGQGLLIPPNVLPFKIYKEEIGNLINGGVHAVFGNTAGVVGVLVGYDS